MNIHYKYFICKSVINNKITIKKRLFLTFYGLRRVIETSRCHYNQKFKDIVIKWLYDLFDDTYISYNIDITNYIIKSKLGYIYCITAPTVNHVKIGIWRSSIDNLYKRYQTYYGNKLNLYYYKIYNVFENEKQCHNIFSKYLISNELFLKSKLNIYLNYLEDISIKIDDTIFNSIINI